MKYILLFVCTTFGLNAQDNLKLEPQSTSDGCWKACIKMMTGVDIITSEFNSKATPEKTVEKLNEASSLSRYRLISTPYNMKKRFSKNRKKKVSLLEFKQASSAQKPLIYNYHYFLNSNIERQGHSTVMERSFFQNTKSDKQIFLIKTFDPGPMNSGRVCYTTYEGYLNSYSDNLIMDKELNSETEIYNKSDKKYYKGKFKRKGKPEKVVRHFVNSLDSVDNDLLTNTRLSKNFERIYSYKVVYSDSTMFERKTNTIKLNYFLNSVKYTSNLVLLKTGTDSLTAFYTKRAGTGFMGLFRSNYINQIEKGDAFVEMLNRKQEANSLVIIPNFSNYGVGFGFNLESELNYTDEITPLEKAVKEAIEKTGDKTILWYSVVSNEMVAFSVNKGRVYVNDLYKLESSDLSFNDYAVNRLKISTDLPPEYPILKGFFDKIGQILNIKQ